MVAPADVAAVLEPVSDTEGSQQGHPHDPEKPFPTEKEWATLPKVPGHIPWTAWTVAVVEFAERFSYYGTTAVCKFTIDCSLHKLY